MDRVTHVPTNLLMEKQVRQGTGLMMLTMMILVKLDRRKRQRGDHGSQPGGERPCSTRYKLIV